ACPYRDACRARQGRHCAHAPHLLEGCRRDCGINEMAEAKVTVERPLSPHWTIYRPMLSMMMSIVHRITGGALYVGTLLLVCWPRRQVRAPTRRFSLWRRASSAASFCSATPGP